MTILFVYYAREIIELRANSNDNTAMYFCIHCFSGKEKEAIRLIDKVMENKPDFDYDVWTAKRECKLKKNGRFVNVEKPMFDGYIFMVWDGEDEKDFPFREIVRIPGIVRFLSYDNGQHALMGKDLSFVSWIHENEGTIKESKVMITEGKKVHFIEGPLVGFDGNVVKIDKHHKKVTVRFEIDGNTADIDFSADFVQKNISIENLTT